MNTKVKRSYNITYIACFFGIFTQAIISNLVPILFMPLREIYGLSFSHLGMLIAINFISQVAMDVIFSGLIDRIGYRPIVLCASFLAGLGLLMLGLTPVIFGVDGALTGLIISTVIFASSGGLAEVVLSPIVDSIPQEESGKGAKMALMHSFYAWGQVICIILTTVAVFIFGGKNWQYIVFAWTFVPFIPFVMFLFAPLEKTLAVGERRSVVSIAKTKFFIVSMLAIFFGAGTEVLLNQWSSSFTQEALQLPKVLGDLVGMCMFAVFLGLGRLLYGIYGKRINIHKVLILGSALSVVCYLLVAVSPWPTVSVIACGLCGLGASLLWPGVISMASAHFPASGGWMYAALATAGDIGAAAFPAMTGGVVDGVIESGFTVGAMSASQTAMRVGILVGTICPIAVLICHIYLAKAKKKSKTKEMDAKQG